MPEKKLNNTPPQSKEDLSKTNLHSSEIKHLKQITTIKNSNQLAHKASLLLPQQHNTAQPLLTIESNRNNQESKMGQDCGSCIAKYILCLFNFIFFVSYLYIYSIVFFIFLINFYFNFLDSWISSACTWYMVVG